MRPGNRRMEGPCQGLPKSPLPFGLPYRGLRDEYTRRLYGDPRLFRHSSLGPDAPCIILPAVGGKTLLWAGHSWRFGPRDFRPRSLREWAKIGLSVTMIWRRTMTARRPDQIAL